MSQETGKNETRQDEIHQHEWTEDGATFTVIDNPGKVHIVGQRFTGGTITSNEAVLAREVLRLAGRVQELDGDLHIVRMAARARVEGVTDRANAKILATEEENLKLTDRLNTLTARIEEALDLLIHETDSSRRVEQAYRMLEKVMVDDLGKELAK